MEGRMYEVFMIMSKFIVFLSVMFTLLLLGIIVVLVLFYGIDCFVHYISKESCIINFIRKRKEENERIKAERCFRGIR